MPDLQIHSADTAPAAGLAEFFGRLPDSALRNRNLSAEAKVLLAGIYLNIAKERTAPLCLATNAELARLIGCTARSIKRRLAALESQEHVEREKVRTIPGSPRAIRPLARLRGIGQVLGGTPTSPRGGTAVSPQRDSNVPPGGQQRPPEGTPMSLPLLLKEEEKKESGKRPADGDEPDGTGTPPPIASEDEEADALAALEEMAAKPGPVGAWARKYLDTRAQEKSPGSTAKHPPGSHARDSAPVEGNCTAPTDQPSRPIHDTEHNRH